MAQASVLAGGPGVREEVLLELVTKEESHDGSQSAALRRGRYKVTAPESDCVTTAPILQVISGHSRDPHWYSEPQQDRVATR